MNLQIPHLDWLRSQDPRQYDIVKSIQDAINNIGKQTNSTAVGTTTAPPNISALSVVASGGVFDFQIFDNDQVSRGVEYFIEYSLTPNFSQPSVLHVGAPRTYRANLGNQTFYFRAYSAYATSPASAPVYFGTASNPTAVAGGGAAAGPAPQASTGSGTAPSTGTQGGAGYGYNQSRSGRFGFSAL